MQYYRLWGYETGLFLAWDDLGWYYGTPQQAAEVLGWLLLAGGTQYTFAMNSQSGVPVVPSFPATPQPSPQPSPFPTIPGLQIPGLQIPS